ncbi:MAG: biotin/lipoyl-containing protein [Planctomycetota bacterium]
MKMRITVNGTGYDVEVEMLDGPPAPVAAAPAPVAAAPAPAAPPPAAPAAPAGSPDAGDVTSPIAGNVLDVKVKAGDTVALNDTLLVLEAMKMESNVASPRAGTVAEVLVAAGDAVTAGQVLVKFA